MRSDCGDGLERVGWFRFLAPPGARKAKLNLDASAVEAWVDGQPARVADGHLDFGRPDSGASRASLVTLRVSFHSGRYAGAAFSDPVEFEMGRGIIAAEDWCRHGLRYYSGGLRYMKDIAVTPAQAGKRIVLDLGAVNTSAEVRVNGVSAGVRLARPFTFDLTGLLKPGSNTLSIEVLNTLANHMSAQPSRYVYAGQTVSGLLGPVTLRFSTVATVRCVPTATR